MPDRDSTVPAVEDLARALDEYEAAEDHLKAAFARKREVEKRIRALLGIEERFMTDDKMVAALLRALVKARESQRASTGDDCGCPGPPEQRAYHAIDCPHSTGTGGDR